MIEPEPICWTDTAATAALIQRSGSPSLRINYDPGNVAWLLNRDPLDEFASAAGWIANVHVKDLLPRPGCPRPEFVPAGEGIIDYQAPCAELQRIGYSGPFSLEPHIDGREETIRRCKRGVSVCVESCPKLETFAFIRPAMANAAAPNDTAQIRYFVAVVPVNSDLADTVGVGKTIEVGLWQKWATRQINPVTSASLVPR